MRSAFGVLFRGAMLGVVGWSGGAARVTAQATAVDSAASYLARARRDLDSGTTAQRAGSVALWMRAAALYHVASDTVHEAEALVGAADAWRVRQVYDSTHVFLLRAADLYRARGDQAGEADALGHHDWFVSPARFSSDSIRLYQRQVLALRRQLRDRPGEVRALLVIGSSFGVGNQVSWAARDSSIAYYREARALARSVSDTLGELLSLNRLGIAFMSAFNADSLHRSPLRDSSSALLNRGVRLATEVNNGREVCADLGNLISLFQGTTTAPRMSDSAFATAQRMLEASKRYNDAACARSGALYRIASMQSSFGYADSARLYAQMVLNEPGENWKDVTLTLLARLDRQVGWPDSALRRYREQERSAGATGVVARLPSIWSNLASTHLERGATDSALFYYRRLAFPTTDEPGPAAIRGTGLYGIADVFASRGRPDSAAHYYRLLADYAATAAGRAWMQNAEEGLGRLAFDIGALDSAVAHFQRAVEMNRTPQGRLGLGAASPLSWIATVDFRAGRIDSSLARRRRALEWFRQSDNQLGVANQLSALGNNYGSIGFPDSNLVYQRAALAVNERMHNRGYLRNNYQSIGSVYLNTDVQDSAMFYFRRALAIASEMDAPLARATTFGSLGVSFSSLGQLDSARVYFEEALALQQQYGIPSASRSTLANLAFLRMRTASDDSAFKLLRRALALAIESQDRAGEGVTRQYLGRAFLAIGRIDSSLAHLRRAVELSRAVRDRPFEGRALAELARVFARQNQPDSARVYFTSAIAIMREAGFARGVRQTLADMAELFRSGGGSAGLSRAAAYFDSAAAVVDFARRGAGGDDNAVSLLESEVDIYGGWARSWIGLRDTIGAPRATLAALGAVERGRAQALVDLLNRLKPASKASAAKAPVPGGNLAAEADALLQPIRASKSAALSYLIAGDTLFTWFATPDGRVSLLPPRHITSDDLSRLIRSSRASLGADDSRSAELDPDELKPTGPGGGNPASAANEDLRKLAEFLLPSDLERRVPPGTPIVVVPHGAIALVPFAALEVTPSATKARTGTRVAAAPLGARHPLRFAPSFAALRATEQSPVVVATRSRAAAVSQQGTPSFAATKPAGKAGNAPVEGSTAKPTKLLANALVVGNPAMPYVYSGRWTTRSQLRALPGAEAESRSIAHTLGASVLTGKAATEHTVRARMSAAPLIHFATHGLAYGTSSAARRSYLAFAPDSTDDGLLTLGELMDDPKLTLHAELVVLSACQTGLGDLKQAEGTIGLQRAFLAKGARSVLVSLWNVDDKATRLLMEKFYAYWLDPSAAQTKAEALRMAQEAVRATPGYAHPKYWAAFQLVGAE